MEAEASDGRCHKPCRRNQGLFYCIIAPPCEGRIPHTIRLRSPFQPNVSSCEYSTAATVYQYVLRVYVTHCTCGISEVQRYSTCCYSSSRASIWILDQRQTFTLLSSFRRSPVRASVSPTINTSSTLTPGYHPDQDKGGLFSPGGIKFATHCYSF